MKNKFFHLIFLLLIILNVGYAQSDTTFQKDKIFPYKITEIPLKIEETTSLIASEQKSFIAQGKVNEAKDVLDSFARRFDNLRKQTDSLDIEQLSSIKINELYRQWGSLQNDLGVSLESITDRARLLGEKKDLFTRTSKIWKDTKEKAVREKAPRDLLSSIAKLQKELDNVNNGITTELNQLLSIQTSFSDKNLFIESELIKLKEFQIKNRRFLFTKNSPPIWIGFADSSNKSVIREIVDLGKEYANAVIHIFSDGERLLLDFFLIVFFLLITFSIRYYSKKLPEDDESAKLAFRILERPYSVTALLFLFFLAFITNESHSSIISLRKIIVLIPLLRVLLNIISKVYKKPLIAVMFLLTLKEIKVNTGSETAVERWLLLVITILSILGILWLRKSGFIQKSVKKEKIKYFLRRGSTVILFLFAVALTANILGYVMLGIFLVNGIYDGIFITILLFTSSVVLNGFLFIVLQTKTAQKLKTVQLYSEKIKKIFRKIVLVVFTFIWLEFVLNSFNIYLQAVDGVTWFLTKEWGIGNFAISFGDILSFALIIWISVQLAKFTRFILEVDILPQFRLPRGVPGAVTSLSRYTILGIGIFIAFLSAGLDLNKFTLLAGALGVGIGFGLQDLVNNFISGIILIFERPVQVGDVIVVGELTGEVKKIGLRSSIIRTWEGAEIIIPNGRLISSEVTNWTFSDKKRRMEIPVGVKYGSDVNLVKKLLLDCASSHNEVLSVPAPVALFKDFGESSLKFELRCWTANSDNRLEIESELRYRIDKAFKENNIEIPFPQRDIHIKKDEKKKNIEE